MKYFLIDNEPRLSESVPRTIYVCTAFYVMQKYCLHKYGDETLSMKYQ